MVDGFPGGNRQQLPNHLNRRISPNTIGENFSDVQGPGGIAADQIGKRATAIHPKFPGLFRHHGYQEELIWSDPNDSQRAARAPRFDNQ